MAFLEKQLNTLERIFNNIERLEIAGDISSVKKIFRIAQQELKNLEPNFNSVNNYYKKFISEMSDDLIEKVRTEYVGYAFDLSCEIVEKAKTINEALFTIHAKINNNVGLYNSIPIIETKENFEGYPIRLRGEVNFLTKSIFDAISTDISLGWTDIISMGNSNKILMMIRDRGHATTIEISWENDVVDVDYFIPKVCNYLMVNHLRGITPVNEDSKYAIGKFRANVAQIPEIIAELIKGIPMDEHMDIEGGKFYKH